MLVQSLDRHTKRASLRMTALFVSWSLLGPALGQGWAGPMPQGRQRHSRPFRVGRGLCSCPGPCKLPLPSKARQRTISSALPPGSRLLAAVQADLDADGTQEWACLTRLGKRFDLVVLERKGRDFVVAGRNRVSAPWHLEIGDVDGDRAPEILVGVRKKSPLDPVTANRSFFYDWDGRFIRPKWLGSRLARRFSDLALADLDGDGRAELYALERLERGKVRISAYRWGGFGFRWVGRVIVPRGRWHLCTTGDMLFAAWGSRKLRITLDMAGGGVPRIAP